MADDGWLLSDNYRDATSSWYYGLGDQCRSCGMTDRYCDCDFQPHCGCDMIDCFLYPWSGDNLTATLEDIVEDTSTLELSDDQIDLYLSSVSSDGTVLLEPQSGLVHDSMLTSGDTQNISFSESVQHEKVCVESVMDPTRMAQDLGTTPLDQFFSRPVKIYSNDWAVGASFQDVFNPWNLYFQNPRVVNRISNYMLMRAKLNLKIVINGNAFLYGRALCSYNPHGPLDTVMPLAPSLAALTQFSQMPHVFINPTTSSGGDMELPFFNYTNYIEIPENEWEVMGDVWIQSLNDLEHANNGAEGVTISIFAWATDVSLSVLTAKEPSTLVPQSGEEIDEANTKGMISGPATAVASAAMNLSTIPPIAPFMVATSAVASTTAKLAKVLGYSRPCRTGDPDPYKPKPFSDLATTTVPDGATKLTIDDKQELSIDPRIAGLGSQDPLNINGIAQRESYVGNFNYKVSNTTEDLLWNALVDPCLWTENGSALYLPATAVAAMPFTYWTGTLNFRFQVVASAYHKGRLKFVYDPKQTTAGNDEYNVNHMQVIDISEKTDFTIAISNGQRVSWLKHAVPGLDSRINTFGTSVITGQNFGNGTISCYVVNDLTTPDTTVAHDIQINVFISAGPDFEVAVPSDEIGKYVFAPQSGEEEIGTNSSIDKHEDEVEHDDVFVIGPTYDLKSNLPHVYMGESIKSFRTLLKRYVLHESVGPLASGDIIIRGNRSMLPYYRGNVPGAVHMRAAGVIPYNYCNTLLVHWMIMAHAGWRGGMRYKMTWRGARHTVNKYQVLEVERRQVDGTYPSYQQEELTWDLYTTQSDAAKAAVIGKRDVTPFSRQSQLGYNGCSRAISDVNPNMEWEVPYYSALRYTPGKLLDVTGTSSGLLQPEQSYEYKLFMNGDTTTLAEMYTAVAEDFQVYFWTGLPAIYRENLPPAL